jgi:hypothetical protein
MKGTLETPQRFRPSFLHGQVVAMRFMGSIDAPILQPTRAINSVVTRLAPPTSEPVHVVTIERLGSLKVSPDFGCWFSMRETFHSVGENRLGPRRTVGIVTPFIKRSYQTRTH